MTGNIDLSFNDLPVRIIYQGTEPWFVAKDVCDILGLENTTRALASLSDDEKSSVTLSKESMGTKKRNIVNEPGLYRLIFKSRLPAASEFKRWVFHDVLPQIRKAGVYDVNADEVTTADQVFVKVDLKTYTHFLKLDRDAKIYENDMKTALNLHRQHNLTASQIADALRCPVKWVEHIIEKNTIH